MFEDEKKTYVVRARELHIAGVARFPGETFEARNTVEVLTHVALGNIALAEETAPPNSPPDLPANSPVDSPPAVRSTQAPRRYMRRDTRAHG